MKGCIHIYEGDGKGKTSTAVGLSVRCAGSGQSVVFSQFLKDNSSSEVAILEQINGITYVRCEKHFGFFFNYLFNFIFHSRIGLRYVPLFSHSDHLFIFIELSSEGYRIDKVLEESHQT